MTTSPIGPIPVDAQQDAAAPAAPVRPPAAEIAAWGMITAAILFVLFRHLVGALIAGLALYLILDRVSDGFARRLSGKRARPLALLIVVAASAVIATGTVAVVISLIRHSAGRIPAMMDQMANILMSTRGLLSGLLGGYGEQVIPEVLTDAESFRDGIALWLKEHSQTVGAAGSYISIGLVHVIMGSLLAVLVFLRHVSHHDEKARGPLSRYLFEKVARFASVFAQIATAQIKISAVNTTLTAIYLLIILPLFGKKLPFTTTLIVVTFVAGLIPVLGNLISNTIITILSLGISLGTAIGSLAFLVLIHKLEYIVNSRIVGSETDSQAWEILMAIIIGESAFGAGGVIMGPIVYAFVKRELRERGLI